MIEFCCERGIITTSECNRSNLTQKELPVKEVYADWSNERETPAPAIFKKPYTVVEIHL